MSREVKFRAWLKNKNKMIDVSQLNFTRENVSDGYFNYYDFEDIELMQYTGLKDKNGKKIFEGDIVRTYRLNADKYLEDRTREYDEFIGVIIWNEEYLEYYIQKNSNEYEDVLKPFERYYEAIGNIYENPELLGREDE